MAFYVGQKVVCVESGPAADGLFMPLVKDRVYTVTCIDPDYGNGVGILVKEAPPPPEREDFSPYYRADRFRPVVERKTDISIFKAMLNPSDERVSA